MNPSEFILFGFTHILTLILIFSISLGFSFYVKDSYDSARYSTFESTLGYLLILNELLKPFYLIALGDGAYRWTNTIPLHACHISSYATGLFLLTRIKSVLILPIFGVLVEEQWLCLLPILN